MEQNGRLIDLKEFLVYLLHRWLPVLLVAVIFCVGMTGYSYHKQSTQSTGGSLNTVRAQNRTAFYQGSTASLYTDANSPEGTYNSRIRIYVDFDLSDFESFETADLSTVYAAYQKDFQTLAVSYDLMEDVIDDLNLRDYEDMHDITGEDLRWMVNRNFEGTHIFDLVVTDTNPVRAQEIVTAIAEKLMDNAGHYVSIRNIRLLDSATLETEIISRAGLNRKQLLKYGAVGFAGGIIVAAIVYLIIFLVRDVVMCRTDVEYAGSHLFGNISRKKEVEEYHSIAVCMELQEGIGSVAIVPVDQMCDAKEIADRIQKCLNEMGSTLEIWGTDTLRNHAESIRKAVNCDVVLMVAKKEKSSVAAIKETVKILNEVHANMIGTVLI